MMSVTVRGQCVFCKQTVEFDVPKEEWDIYNQGRGPVIQEAMPSLTVGPREFIISQMCEKCFDDVTAEVV